MIYKKPLDDVCLMGLRMYLMGHSYLDNVLEVVDGVNFLLAFPLKVLEINITQICF